MFSLFFRVSLVHTQIDIIENFLFLKKKMSLSKESTLTLSDLFAKHGHDFQGFWSRCFDNAPCKSPCVTYHPLSATQPSLPSLKIQYFAMLQALLPSCLPFNPEWLPLFLSEEVKTIRESTPMFAYNYPRLMWMMYSVLACALIWQRNQCNRALVPSPYLPNCDPSEREYLDDLLSRLLDYESDYLKAAASWTQGISRFQLLVERSCPSTSESRLGYSTQIALTVDLENQFSEDQLNGKIDDLFRSTLLNPQHTGVSVWNPSALRSEWDGSNGESSPEEKYSSMMIWLVHEVKFRSFCLPSFLEDELHTQVTPSVFIHLRDDDVDHDVGDLARQRHCWLVFAVLGCAMVWERNGRHREMVPSPWIPEITSPELEYGQQLLSKLLDWYEIKEIKEKISRAPSRFRCMTHAYVEYMTDKANQMLKLIDDHVTVYRAIKTFLDQRQPDQPPSPLSVSTLQRALYSVTNEGEELSPEDVEEDVSEPDEQELAQLMLQSLRDLCQIFHSPHYDLPLHQQFMKPEKVSELSALEKELNLSSCAA